MMSIQKSGFRSSMIIITLAVLILLPGISFAADDDHGNSINTATKITGNKVRGKLETKGDQDFFYFRARKNKTYYIRTTSKMQLALDMMDSEGNYLGADNGYNGAEKPLLIYLSSSKGDVYIRVMALRHKDRGKYKLTLETLKTSRSTPAARADYAIAYDPDTHNTLMFGGAYGGTYFSDSWAWNGNKWIYFRGNSTGDGLPAARARHCMVYDEKRGVFILFGGRNHDTVFGDTWELNGDDWRKVSGAGPTAREGAAMVWDSENEVVLLFGGKNEETYHSDLWQWDGGKWEEIVPEDSAVAPAVEPSGRAFHGMAYDSNKKTVVVFGGYNDARRALDDTWVWDGTSWYEVADNYWNAKGRRSFGMTYNSEEDYIYLFGGFDGYKRNYDDTRYLQVYTYGTDVSYYWYILWTYYYSGNPKSRSGISLVYDAYRDEMLFFGGWDNGVLYNDTWILRNQEWHEF